MNLRRISDLLLRLFLGLSFRRLRSLLLLRFFGWLLRKSCSCGGCFAAPLLWFDALPHRWVIAALLEAWLHVVLWLDERWSLFTVIKIRFNLLLFHILIIFLLNFLLNLLSTLRWVRHVIRWLHFWWFVWILLIELRLGHDLLLVLLERGRARLENLNRVRHLRLGRLRLFNGNGLLARRARYAHRNGGQVLFMRLPDPLRVGRAALDGFTHKIFNLL